MGARLDGGQEERDARPPSDAAAVEPDATVVEPDATVIEPDATVIGPDSTVIEPDSTVEPDGAVELDSTVEPDGAVEPDAVIIDPDAAVEPDAVIVEPDAAVEPQPCVQVEGLRVTALPPSGLQARFNLTDCDGEPLDGLTPEGLAWLDLADQPLAEAPVISLGAPEGLTSSVILALDLSQGVYDAGLEGDIISAAQGFVAQALQAPGREVALAPFGRLDAFEVFADFSGDANHLIAQLELLREAPARGQSELYGSYVRALGHLEARIAEGPHAAAAVFLLGAPPSDALSRRAAVDQTREATDARVYAVAVRGDYDEALLEPLGTPGAGLTLVGQGALLGAPLRAISAELVRAADSHYALGACGAPTEGAHLALSVGAETAIIALSYEAGLLDGDASGCAPDLIRQGVICTPASATCDGDLLEVCDADGLNLERTDCAAEPDQICWEGACVAPECEAGQTQPCGEADVGPCQMGEAACVDRRWGPCEGAVLPEPEVCDGVDNDCDGEIDDDLAEVFCGVGACVTQVPACAEGAPVECVPGEPGAEILNNEIDDDCDGEVDEVSYGVISGRVVTCPKLEEAGGGEGQAARATVRPGQLIAALTPEAVEEGLRGQRLIDAIQPHTDAKLRLRHMIGARLVSVAFDVDEADHARAIRQTWAVVDALRGAKPIAVIAPEVLSQPAATPNDPLYPLQRWHYELMQLPAAWDLQQGAQEARVAVLDTGIMEEHADIAERLIPGYDFASEGFDGDGWDDDPHDHVSDSFVCRDWDNPDCPHFHGTHVAGTVGAAGDNNSHGAGVAWRSSIQAVRVLGYQGGTFADILSGMYWAAGLPVDGAPANPTPVDVMNLSLGALCRPEGCEAYGCDDYCDQVTQLYEVAADEIIPTGVLVVVAAGNNDIQAADFVPAAIDRFLTVGAVRPDAQRASYSNHGAAVEVMAPGGAGWYEGNDEDRVWSLSGEDGFEALPGTSMAAPHVAGLAALLKSAEPALTAQEIRGHIVDTAGPVGRCVEGCGAGLVNAYAALSELGGGAAGGELKLASRYLDFGSALTEARLWFWNTGEAPMDWVAWPDTAGHVSERVALQPSEGTLEPGAWGYLDVVVLRYGLEEGRYGSFVIIEAGPTSGVVPLAFRVGEPCLEIPSVEITAYHQGEQGELIPVAETTAWAAADFAYALEEVPAGYPTLVYAEVNPEGELEPGDYYGRWPFLSDPQPITVQPDGQREGVDINLAPFVIEGQPGFPGSECATDADCAGIEGGVCFAFESVPGGYCSRRCTEDRWCPIGGACVDFEGGDAYCLASCEAHEECRVHDNQECWAYHHGLDLCLWQTAVPGKVPVGLSCGVDADCFDADGGVCLPDEAGGYCSAMCQSDAGCPFGSVCVEISEGQSFCLDGCEAPEHCRRPTHACYALGDAGICWLVPLGEPCLSDGDCGAAMECLANSCQIPCESDEICVQGSGTCGANGLCEPAAP